MPPNDLFAALDQYKKNSESVELSTGLVLSVGTLAAQIAVGRSAGSQRCSYNSDLVLQRLDTVLLIRTSGSQLWIVVNVIGRAKAGSSVINRPTPSNAPGSPRFASNTTLKALLNSWSGTTIVDVGSGYATFSGGSAALMCKGYATPGASDVNLEIGWGEDGDYVPVFNATIKSTTPQTPINFFHVLDGQLIGTHAFNVRAKLSAAGITVYAYLSRLSVLEI